MIVRMPQAFGRTQVACSSAQRADAGREHAVARHRTRREAAQLRAFDVERDAGGQRMRIAFGEARGRTRIACVGTRVASGHAVVVLIVHRSPHCFGRHRHGVSFTFIQPGSRVSNARYASIAFVSGSQRVSTDSGSNAPLRTSSTSGGVTVR